MVSWVLCSCGFSPLVFTEGEAGPVREICRTDYEPLLTVSSAWDACHVLLEKSETSCLNSVTLGRWSREVEKVKGHLFQNEEIKEIMEVGNKMILKTTNKRLFIKEGKSIAKLESDPCVDRIHCMEADDDIIVHLKNGHVYMATLLHSSVVLQLRTIAVLSGVQIKGVTCANNHALLTDNSGRVWSLGLNNRGQLGHGDILPRPHPSIIEALDGIRVVEVDCGYWHNLALSEYGDVYSWGWNKDGQLGHSADSATISIPTLVELGEDMNFVSVKCGTRHSAALSLCGRVYTWGWNGYGQLGHLKSIGPVVMASGGVVSWIHCGPWITLYLIQQQN